MNQVCLSLVVSILRDFFPLIVTSQGSDTTATAISATLFYLIHNSDSLKKLQQEIRPLFKEVEEIRGGAMLNSCIWLRACIEEAMRMSPGVPGLLPRQVLRGGVEIGGQWFPEGIDLGVPHYAIHHNEDHYPDSFTYRPERWIADTGTGEQDENRQQQVAAAKSAFCPFSIGPRGCVGKSLAMKELMVTIARVIWLYDIRFAPGKELHGTGGERKGFGRHRSGEYQLRDMFVAKTEGPTLQFRRRRVIEDNAS